MLEDDSYDMIEEALEVSGRSAVSFAEVHGALISARIKRDLAFPGIPKL